MAMETPPVLDGIKLWLLMFFEQRLLFTPPVLYIRSPELISKNKSADSEWVCRQVLVMLSRFPMTCVLLSFVRIMAATNHLDRFDSPGEYRRKWHSESLLEGEGAATSSVSE